jgi:hypothetical protein
MFMSNTQAHIDYFQNLSKDIVTRLYELQAALEQIPEDVDLDIEVRTVSVGGFPVEVPLIVKATISKGFEV